MKTHMDFHYVWNACMKNSRPSEMVSGWSRPFRDGRNVGPQQTSCRGRL